MLLGDAEQLSNELWSVAQIFLDQLGADDSQERGRRLVRNGLGQQGLARAGRSVQDDTFRGSKFEKHNKVNKWAILKLINLAFQSESRLKDFKLNKLSLTN